MAERPDLLFRIGSSDNSSWLDAQHDCDDLTNLESGKQSSTRANFGTSNNFTWCRD